MNSTNWWPKLIVFGLTLVLASCQPGDDGLVSISGPTMGTSYSVKVANAEVDKEALAAKVERRLLELNEVLSTFIADSELSLLNAGDEMGPIVVSGDLKAVLEVSLEVYQLSGGAFDVTVGPVVNLWGFGPAGPRDGVPSPEQIAVALGAVGFGGVSIEGHEMTKPANIYIDLSAVAKGYAVDEIAALVEEVGASGYMVEIGGEVRANGVNQRGETWRIGIEAPEKLERRLHTVMPLDGLALATSGDYRNYFEHEGVSYSHTIDPRTGWPVSHNLASVTVLHQRAAMADALATAFTVLGPEKALSLSEELNLPVLAIIRTDDKYTEIYSSEMTRYLESR